MNDLVQRLREEQFDGWSGDAVCVDAKLASEAADIIEEMMATIESYSRVDLAKISDICAGSVQMPGSEGHRMLKDELVYHLSKALPKSNPNTPERNDE